MYIASERFEALEEQRISHNVQSLTGHISSFFSAYVANSVGVQSTVRKEEEKTLCIIENESIGWQYS